ncbi:MAG: aldehyde dehydrogenase family protein [Polyangiaceae bacterium]|nr:aldehyde dehydrogenase family protein [Polyangiaceae bacterium]
MNALSSRTLVVRSPATDEVLRELAEPTPDEVAHAVARAHTAQRAWGSLDVRERCRQLRRFRHAIAAAADELVEVLVGETGKPRLEALLHELTVLVDAMAWIERKAPGALAPRRVRPHLLWHRAAWIHYRPRGVVAVISPYNLPLAIPIADATAALATGAAVVVKPSEHTPLVALRAKALWDGLGLDPDLFQVLPGGAAVGEALVRAGVDRVALTGGAATGRAVATVAAEELVECMLELGGNAPLLASGDADVELTARAVVFGGFINCGQACIAVERVYAHTSIHDALVARVTELTRSLRVGGGKGTVDVGPLIHPRQIPHLERLVADAVARGARVCTGGERRPGPGRFFMPTILSECTQAMAVVREEIFGPIVPIVRVTTEDEAVALANDSAPALTAYVFARSRRRAHELGQRLRAGSIVVGDVVSHYASPELPFGGLHGSGWGRVHGIEGLRAHAETCTVTLPRSRFLDSRAFWFPYEDGLELWVRRFIRFFHARGPRR